MSADISCAGHLVRTTGVTEFSETVDGELKRALEWLHQPERYEPRRYASVLILKELALNAPTLFNVHVANFVNDIWVALTGICVGGAFLLKSHPQTPILSFEMLQLKLFEPAWMSFLIESSQYDHSGTVSYGQRLER